MKSILIFQRMFEQSQIAKKFKGKMSKNFETPPKNLEALSLSLHETQLSSLQLTRSMPLVLVYLTL